MIQEAEKGARASFSIKSPEKLGPMTFSRSTSRPQIYQAPGNLFSVHIGTEPCLECEARKGMSERSFKCTEDKQPQIFRQAEHRSNRGAMMRTPVFRTNIEPTCRPASVNVDATMYTMVVVPIITPIRSSRSQIRISVSVALPWPHNRHRHPSTEAIIKGSAQFVRKGVISVPWVYPHGRKETACRNHQRVKTHPEKKDRPGWFCDPAHPVS